MLIRDFLHVFVQIDYNFGFFHIRNFYDLIFTFCDKIETTKWDKDNKNLNRAMFIKKQFPKTTFGCFLDQGPEQLSSETLEQHDDQTSVQCIRVVHSFSLSV